MTFSRRERLILLVTTVVLGALVLDRFALTPLLNRWDEVEDRKTLLMQKMTRAESFLKRRRVVEPRWRRMLKEGIKPDAGEAESQILHALGRWAGEAGLNLVSLQPERSTEETILPKVDFRATGTGSMRAVSRFLWHVETTNIPLRVESLQLTSRKDGADDLSLQVKLSTLYAPGQAAARTRAETETKPETTGEKRDTNGKLETPPQPEAGEKSEAGATTDTEAGAKTDPQPENEAETETDPMNEAGATPLPETQAEQESDEDATEPEGGDA